MRRKFFLFIMIFAMMVGCGKNDEPNISEEILRDENVIETTNQELTVETQKESFNDYNFEPMEEIVNATIYEGKIQFGDIIVRQTELVQELIADLENSEVDWNYEYSPEQLIDADYEGKKIYIKCGEETVFSFEAKNYTYDAIALKDCVVRNIEIDPGMKRNIYYGQGYCIDGKNVPSYSEYVNICQKAKCKPSEEEQGNGDVITLWNYPCVDVKVPSQKIAFASEPGAVLYEGHYLTNEATFNSKTGKCTRFIVDRPETSFLYIRNYEPETEDSDYIRVGLWSIGISNIDDYFVGIYEGESGSYLELCDNGEFYYENEHMYDAGRWSYEGGMLCFTNEYYAKTYTSLEFMLCRIDGEGNEEEVEGMFRVTE